MSSRNQNIPHNTAGTAPPRSRFITDIVLRAQQLLRTNRNFQHIYTEGEILIALVAAWYYGHRPLSWFSILIIVAALVYVLSPLDFIPDVIPLFGFADDIFVLRTLFKHFQNEMGAFRIWRQENNDINVYRPPHRD